MILQTLQKLSVEITRVKNPLKAQSQTLGLPSQSTITNA